MSESPKQPKMNEETLLTKHLKGIALPDWATKLIILAMQEAVSQERTRILGLVEEEIKKYNTPYEYGSGYKIFALNELKTKIQEGE